MILVIGIKESADANNAMVLLKVGIIVFFIAVGLFLIHPIELDQSGNRWIRAERAGGHQRGCGDHLLQLHRLRRRVHGRGRDAESRQGHAVRHHHEPGRDDRALHAISVVMTGMAPWQQLGTAEPMITALRFAAGPPALLNASRFIVALGAVIAMGSVLLVFQLRAAAHLLLDGARRAAAAGAAKVHPKYKTPYVGTILTGIFVAVFAAFANIAEVVDLTNIGTLFAFVLVSAGVIVLRRTDPERPRPFRVPLVPLTPLISHCGLLLSDDSSCRVSPGFGLSSGSPSAWCSTSLTAIATRRCANRT